jgi:hypothetical protein
MNQLSYTLVSDGSSDRLLRPILDWALRENSAASFEGHWADLRQHRDPPKELAARVTAALRLRPCNLLFIHRDSERVVREDRVLEIQEAVRLPPELPAVCVVPVRMTEAWLLLDESAVRIAAGNPAGKESLDMPSVESLERLADPKTTLYQLLRRASARKGRRLDSLRPQVRVHRLAELLKDFSPLRSLSAFRAFEADLREVLSAHGW